MSKAVSARDTRRGSRPRRDRLAFTLIEVLVATGLTLMLMAAVAGIFALVSNSISDARATLEMTDLVRGAQNTLQRDLEGMTARGVPPLDPAEGRGYTEILEGPIGPCGLPNSKSHVSVVVGAPNSSSNEVGKILLTDDEITAAIDKGQTVSVDTTVGDIDDVLMLTTRSNDVPFTGRGGPGPASTPARAVIIEAQSNVAEVAWFVRGRTLYRRVLLVDPTYDASGYTDSNGQWVYQSPNASHSYYDLCDISVRQVGGAYDPTTMEPARLVANSLSDLTKRENRFGHQPMIGQVTSPGPVSPNPARLVTNWPHDARFWGPMRLPTLRESSDPNWPLPFYAPHNGALKVGAGVIQPNGFPVHPNTSTFTALPTIYFPPEERVRFDAWNDPREWTGIDTATGGIIDNSIVPAPGDANVPLRYPGKRFADDVILTNVVGFDIKVWDSGAPIFQKEMRIGVQSGSTEAVTVAPGDPGYYQCLLDLLANPNGANLPVAYGAFVDLGWAVDPTSSTSNVIYPASFVPPANKWPKFNGAGNFASGLSAIYSDQTVANPQPDFRTRVYDTGSSHYERDGVDQGFVPNSPRGNAPDGFPDYAADGIDNNPSVGAGIDDPTEREAPPPYDAELKAIQIKIRVFEPDSRQIREVTVVQELVSQ
jgi:type II secretory pathway pseudopilin PulG